MKKMFLILLFILFNICIIIADEIPGIPKKGVYYSSSEMYMNKISIGFIYTRIVLLDGIVYYGLDGNKNYIIDTEEIYVNEITYLDKAIVWKDDFGSFYSFYYYKGEYYLTMYSEILETTLMCKLSFEQDYPAE